MPPNGLAGLAFFCAFAGVVPQAETLSRTAPHVDARLSRAVVVFEEGLDWTVVTKELLQKFNRAESVEHPRGVDAAGVASRVSTGCDRAATGAVSSLSAVRNGPATGKLHVLANAFTHEGKKVGVVTSRCLDDGTTSPFLARWGDRYDLEAVSALVNKASIEVAAAGWSDALQARAGIRVRTNASATSPYAATCAYQDERVVEGEAVDALRELERVSPRGYLLVVVQSAMLRGGRDPARVNATARRLAGLVGDATLAFKGRSLPDWVVVAFGSRDPSRASGRAAVLVAAPPGSHLLSPGVSLSTYGEIGRALAPGLSCGDAARHAVAHPADDSSDADGWGALAALLVFVVTLWCFAAFCCWSSIEVMEYEGERRARRVARYCCGTIS